MKALLILFLLAASGCAAYEQAMQDKYYKINTCHAQAAKCSDFSGDPSCTNFLLAMRGRNCTTWYSEEYSPF